MKYIYIYIYRYTLFVFYLFIYSFAHLFMYLLICLFITCLFIHLFIYSFISCTMQIFLTAVTPHQGGYPARFHLQHEVASRMMKMGSSDCTWQTRLTEFERCIYIYIYTMWGPQTTAFSQFITTMSLWFILITMVPGAYKPT